MVMADHIDPVRGDIAELRHEMQTLAARMEGAIETSAKEQLRFFFLAWGVQLAAIVDPHRRGPCDGPGGRTQLPSGWVPSLSIAR